MCAVSLFVMTVGLARAQRVMPVGLAALTLVSVGVLLVVDTIPYRFSSQAHDRLAALPLILVAVAHVIYQAFQRAPFTQWAKTGLLSLAFLFWAANQLCANRALATLFNDIAIAAFVVDALLIIGWHPRASRDTGEPERGATQGFPPRTHSQ
jgi:hypothetical protein